MLVLFAGTLLTSIVQAATLNIQLAGFKNNQGQVLIYLHNKAEFFPTKPDKAILSKIIKIQNKAANTQFDNIEPGVYALSIVHDENNNGELETNFIGIPKEGVGTSNNVRGRFGPPSFRDASFTFENDTTLSITVHY